MVDHAKMNKINNSTGSVGKVRVSYGFGQCQS